MPANNSDTQEAADKHNASDSRSILIKGFSFITLFIVTMAAIGFYIISANQQRIELILEEQTEMRAIFAMRDAALQRTLILRHMAMLEDEFDRDDAYMNLKAEAEKFIRAREIFLEAEAQSPTPKVMQIWKAVQADIRKGAAAQEQVAELILNDDIKQANQIMLSKAIPIQNHIMAQLTELLDLQREKTEEEVSNTYQQNTTGLILLGLIAAWTIIWGIAIAQSSVKRITRFEESLDKEKLKAQEADQQKSQFLANMSHEIRTPLTAIIGYSEILAEDNHKITDWKQHVNSIIRNGKHLHQLIDDILDLSKIEADQLSMEVIPVEVYKLTTEVKSLIGEQATKKGLDFALNYHYPIPKTIFSDPTRLKQILINLCGNAIKFTEKGHITLNIKYEQTRQRLIFTIADTGIGMTQEQVAKLFKPFKQADSATTRKFGGTGLGLYISKQLSERLGGELSLESQPGVGSKFTVAIEAVIQEGAEWINSEKEASSLVQKTQLKTEIPALRGKILLAEDNPDNQALISLHIKKTGAKLKIVENGQQAVEAALHEHFDLVLMDLQMPVMGGNEAIKRLRTNHYKTPIATLTANAMKEDTEESRQAGADEFLTKPIDRKKFYNVLAKHLPPAIDSDNRPEQSNIYNEPDDLDDFRDLVDVYVNQLSETCRRIERSVDNALWESVTDEIHQLKGTGSAFGLPEITEQCTSIEMKLFTKDYVSAQQLISQLKDTCKKIVKNHTFLSGTNSSHA